MIKKFIACLSIFLFSLFVLADHIVLADEFHLVASGAIMIQSNGAVSLQAQSSRYTSYIDLSSYSSGTITITFSSGAYGSWLRSNYDDPSDVEIGYTFISNDFSTFSNVTTVSIPFSNITYLYVSYNKNFQFTIATDPDPSPSPSVTPEVSPSITPTVTPTPITPQPDNGFIIHYDVPFDYYMIIIIILLGGILVCQLFKN